ncbi:MAG: AAA family ATPase, partial [Clostridia bacterium]|nr:AAA family ATPase [Clostridia bacterium]
MYLKSLELHGFKSFPDRTVLRFNRGATMIVGPNGSGKSNITDAMRWVLGELSTKNIRGSKMEDVIFAGASDRKPMSFAEVSVTFDDSEEPRSLQSPYDEVTVTRRYYRSGDSEYFINRKKCRLKDIYELFMNTGIGREGYSIIGQGRIAEIISKKSDERRGVFEESAGIARFRYKKTESEKKLAETEANMERVSDIEHELSVRIGPLEKDAAKARQYLELYGEKKKNDVSLWLYDSERLKAAVEQAEGDTKLSAHELEMAEDSIKLTSAQIERLYEQSHSNKEASRRNYEETTAATKRMTDAESEAKLLAKERIHAESTLTTEKTLTDAAVKAAAAEEDRIRTLNERCGTITGMWNEAKTKYDACTARLTELDERIRGFTDQLDALLREQKTAENDMTELRVRLNVLENSIASQKKRTESIQSDIHKYEEEIAALDKTAEDANRQIGEYKKVLAEIDAEIAVHAKNSSAQREAFAQIDRKQRQKQAELDSLDSRIAAMTRMQEHFDGYNNSIKHIMNESKSGRLNGIRGPLSYLIKVEPQYIVAIETTLGAALQNIVTEDEPSTKRAIESLKRNNAGRATFYPMTTVRAQE